MTSQEADNLSEGAEPKENSKKLDLFKNMKSMSSNEGNGEYLKKLIFLIIISKFLRNCKVSI